MRVAYGRQTYAVAVKAQGGRVSGRPDTQQTAVASCVPGSVQEQGTSASPLILGSREFGVEKQRTCTQ